MPHPSRKVKVPVTKCYACHANSGGARQIQPPHPIQPSAISAMPATLSDIRCRQVPRLPRKVELDVAKPHACHAKWKSMSPSATYHAKWTSMSPSATPATPTGAATAASTGNQGRHQSQPSATSATPATPSLCE